MGARVRVKICGITRLQDALLAEELGAYALASSSPRAPGGGSPPKAREISQALGPFTVRVGVFRDQEPEEVLRLMEEARLQVAQLHGGEPPEWAEAVGRFFPVIKAFPLEVLLLPSGPTTPPPPSSWTAPPREAASPTPGPGPNPF